MISAAVISAARTSAQRSCRHRLRTMIVFLLLAGTVAAAQSNPSEHVFHVSRADLDKALASLHATSPGRLPILDGFVAPEVSALEKYQRAYFQYKLDMRPAGAGATALRVSAKVTAWYTGDKTAQAGYRVLPSNGRLETDLVERLEEALQQKSADVAGDTPSNSSPTQTTTDRTSLGDRSAPRSAKSSTFGLTFPREQPNSRAAMTPPDSHELAQQKRFQQLSDQAANLEEVLHNQAHPNDLAAVRKAGTPVFAKPIEPGDVLFRADAEDEFKVLDESGGWVHVQVSGISRGWIRRPDLEMPGEAIASSDAATKQPATSPEPETHEETSSFPGEWTALRGRMVRIAWVQPASDGAQAAMDRWQLARSVFRSTYDRISRSNMKVDGVVLVIDAADGGMVAATIDALRRWNTGAISDAAFRKECWTDSPEALGESAHRESGDKSQSQ
jgi:hypothetical protein